MLVPKTSAPCDWLYYCCLQAFPFFHQLVQSFSLASSIKKMFFIFFQQILIFDLYCTMTDYTHHLLIIISMSLMLRGLWATRATARAELLQPRATVDSCESPVALWLTLTCDLSAELATGQTISPQGSINHQHNERKRTLFVKAHRRLNRKAFLPPLLSGWCAGIQPTRSWETPMY